MTRAITLATAAAISVAALSGASAQDDNLVIQMDEFTCKDMLIRSGFERDFTVAYMHGFMSGKMNETEFDVAKLTAATDAVLEYCIQDPEATLLSAFEEARGQ
jgi:hypothetical protein